MQIKRSANAVWKGTGKEGKGVVTTASKTLSETPYTWASRFQDASGTNPEELVAAAHAGCYSMKLAFLIVGAGFTPDTIETKATTVLENDAIQQVHLTTRVRAQGLSNDKFQELAREAKAGCPISRSLKAEISLEAELAG